LTWSAWGVTLEDGPLGRAVTRIPEGFHYMAKALLGTFQSDQRTAAHLLSENTRLRVRVRDLEDLVARLQDENDRMAQAAAVAILEMQSDELKEMQPV
jgi:cell division septum initiation protein DivIVA